MNDFVGSRPTGVDWAGAGYGMARFGEDTRLVVIFYTRSLKNDAKSREFGVPYNDNAVFVRIHEPGERLNVVDRPMQEGDKQRFHLQWSKFIQNQEQIPEGTPIDLLFPNNPALSENLKAQGVHTIQQCANLSANAIDNIGMGAQEYVNLAKKYLSSATDGLAFHKMQEQIVKKDQDYKILQHQFDQLKNQFNMLLERINDPVKASQAPSWVEGHDAPTERIDSNHPSKELSEKQAKKRKNMPAPVPIAQALSVE